MGKWAATKDKVLGAGEASSVSDKDLGQTEQELASSLFAIQDLEQQKVGYQHELERIERSILSALMQDTKIDILCQYCKSIDLAALRDIGIETLSDVPFQNLDSLSSISTETAENIISATNIWKDSFPWEKLSPDDTIIVSSGHKIAFLAKRMAKTRLVSVLKNQAKNLEELTNQANSLQKTMLEYMLRRNVFWRKKKRKATIDAHLAWQKFPEEWKTFAKECEEMRLKETLSSKEAVEYILQHQDTYPAAAMSLIKTFLLKNSFRAI